MKKTLTLCSICIAGTTMQALAERPEDISKENINAQSITDTQTEEARATIEMWQRFFGDLRTPGNGLVPFIDCLTKTQGIYTTRRMDDEKNKMFRIMLDKMYGRYGNDKKDLISIAQMMCREIPGINNDAPLAVKNYFASVNEQECGMRLCERRVAELFIEFLNGDKKESYLQWKRFNPLITSLLEDNPQYAELCKDLRGCIDSTSSISVGLMLNKHKVLLPKEICDRIASLGYIGALSLFSKRLK